MPTNAGESDNGDRFPHRDPRPRQNLIFDELAELERSIIRERTRAGLASARARGRKGGRPKKLNDREWRAIRTLVDARELTIAEIASQYDVSPATIYRRLP